MKILKEIRGVSLGSFVTRGERLAFWINTYNALVADGIAALGLRRSVWELPNFFQRVGCRVGGAPLTPPRNHHRRPLPGQPHTPRPPPRCRGSPVSWRR